MPKKLLSSNAAPSLVQERLETWGACIRKQRIQQRLTALALCQRMEISDATLRRLEKGDPGAGAGLYLTALMILGVLNEAAPILPPVYWSGLANQRVRASAKEMDDSDF